MVLGHIFAKWYVQKIPIVSMCSGVESNPKYISTCRGLGLI